jgi:hypothetical protein
MRNSFLGLRKIGTKRLYFTNPPITPHSSQKNSHHAASGISGLAKEPRMLKCSTQDVEEPKRKYTSRSIRR